jgi:hypothetical protein
MQKIFLFVCLISISEQAFSQAKDTVRSNVDYRSVAKVYQNDDVPTSTTLSDRYFSLQANQLLRQLFSLSNTSTNTGNPFSLTYAFNNKQTGNGMAFGLGYFTSHVEDTDQGNDRETDNSNINFRIGYDKKGSIGKRWTAGWGFDLLLSRSKNFTTTDQGGFISEIEDKSNGWGFGPRGSLLFQVNGKIHLGTETSWYFQSEKIKSDISFGGGGSQKSEQKSSVFALQVPVAIFLTIKF